MKIDEDHRGIRRDPENEKYNDDDSDNDRWRDLGCARRRIDLESG